MNGKKARQLRKLVECDLSGNSADKEQFEEEVGTKLIAQIHPDGNHTEREQKLIRIRTTANRFLYRQLKEVYTIPNKEPTIRGQLIEDLNTAELTAKTKTEDSHE